MKGSILTILLGFFAVFFPSTVPALNLAPLKEKLAAVADAGKATVGIAVIYDRSDTITVNNDLKYPLMSVFKLHQAVAVLKVLEKTGMSLSRKLFVSEKELLPDTWSPLREKYPQGGINLSISDLLAFSLQLSDNNACDILFNRFADPAETDRIVRSLGIEDFSISQNEDAMHKNLANCYLNWSTPLAVAQLMEKIASGEILPEYLNSFLMKMLLGCKTGQDRLPKYLQNIQLGHKTGTGDRNENGEIIGVNDVGFVSLPNGKRYVIAVLIKNSRLSIEETAEIIARISKITFDYILNAE